jgi:hypothetical protein
MMQSVLEIHSTEDTPEIVLNSITGKLIFSGKSLPEDAFHFYQPVVEWLNTYRNSSNEITTAEFRFEYFNTASSKQIFKLLCLLKELSSQSRVIVKWYYEKGDKDMQVSGERFSRLCQLPLEIQQI